MFDIFSRFIIGLIISIAGFIALKQLLKSSEKISSLKNIILILLLTLPTVLFYKSEYNITLSIITFFCTIVIYKLIFKLSITQAVISQGILMIIITFSDVIVSTFLSFFITVQEMRSDFSMMILSNLLVAVMAITISHIPFIKERLYKFITNLDSKNMIKSICFFVLFLIVVCTITYNLYITFAMKENFFTNVIIMGIFLILTSIYIKEQNSFNKLNHEYEILFNYVQNFEDWIEKEQLNRHELKNSLGSIMNVTRDKNVQKKIGEILNDNISVEEKWIEQLKYLPKGTLKGLLYYKMAVAQKKHITITTDLSSKTTRVFNKLTNDDWKILSKLIGIYLDNAIEASLKTKKKRICIEIYSHNENLHFVISNTVNKSIDINLINKKGYTTKGKGHGNGLHYAQKLILKNKHILSKQQVINDYYIQTVIIETTKKEK